MRSNERLMVSVRMNVPDTRATPSTIAVAVSAVRSLRAPRPLSVRASTGSGGHGRLAVLDDAPVGEHHRAVGDRGGVGVVGDHDHGLAVVVDGGAQEGQDVV